MTQISLSVISLGGHTQESITMLFDSSRMIMPKSEDTGTKFHYPNEDGRIVEVIVEESLSAVATLMGVSSTTSGAAKQARLLFDATGGKATGTYALVDADTGAPFSLPDNAYITRAWREVLTTFTSSDDSGTIALGIATDDATGIEAAVAISNGANPWDAGVHECDQDGTVANFTTKTTGERSVIATVGTQALTAGKMIVVFDYVVTA